MIFIQPVRTAGVRPCAKFLSIGLAIVGTAVAAPGEPTGMQGDPALKLKASQVRDEARAGLVPWPARGEISKEMVKVGMTTRIVYSSPDLEPLAKILAGQIGLVGSRRLPVAPGPPRAGDICLRVDPKLGIAKDPQATTIGSASGLDQRVMATAKGVLIEGQSYQATAMATMTFLQALTGSGESLRFPRMKIEDWPGSRYSGTMVDVARQWHPVEHLYDLVDLCRLYKVQFLHIHFSDDQGYRLPSKSYPAISTKGASYTEKEIKDLVTYSDARGVTIIPEVEVPGHSTALQTAHPEIFGGKDPASGKFEALGVLNIANEAIYPVLETIIAETCELFKSSPYFHLGADETNFGRFFGHPGVRLQLNEMNARGISDGQVFGHFLNRMNAVVKKQGKRSICWEGFGPEMEVDKDIVIMAWHGSSHAPQDLLKAGFDIINVPWTPSIYSSMRENYEWNKWNLNLSESPGHSRQFEMDQHVIGGQMVLWEKGPDEMIRMLRDKMPARQERVYNPVAGLGFNDFNRRWAHTDAILEKLLYPVQVKLEGTENREENLFHDKPVKVTLDCPVKDATVRYTFGKDDPTASTGEVYDGPFPVDPERAGNVYINGYYGPRAELRVRAFLPDGQALGGTKWTELRCEAPRVAYVIHEAAEGTALKEMPATARMKVFAEGKLARIESTNRIAVGTGGPLVLQATGKLDIRTAGDYEITVSAKNPDAAKNTILLIGDRVMGPFKDGEATITLAAGIQSLAIRQFANDRNVGVTLTFKKYLQDGGSSPRSFNNEYLHQWMTPLVD